MRHRGVDLLALEERIGHVFKDPKLFAAALTHVSAMPTRKRETYQRLEFLGDRVLGLVIAEMLYQAFPEAEEGELSRRLAGLVRKESCAEAATAWGVGPFIRTSESEKQAGIVNMAILADVCESIIGAVFLDGGYDAARGVIVALFDAHLQSPEHHLRDPKTTLQEWAQARGLPTPLYRETARSGPDHAPEFTVCVEVQGYASAEARGLAKRAAEQAAAATFIAREGIGERGQGRQKGAA